jgi:hypothetical protein
MQEVPKRIKRLVREWAAIAHERDLRKSLSDLRAQFDRWDRGEIDSFELNGCIVHQETAKYGRIQTNHLEPRSHQRLLPACSQDSRRARASPV